MSLNIRRVVTGHDKNGKATVKIDEMVKNVASARPGAHCRGDLDKRRFPGQQRRRH